MNTVRTNDPTDDSRPLLLAYFSATYFFQKSTEALYFSNSKGTPLPPCSLPSALRITVIGCIGNS